jgi:hypothetical protein
MLHGTMDPQQSVKISGNACRESLLANLVQHDFCRIGSEVIHQGPLHSRSL